MEVSEHRVVIVGGGFSGIGVAIRLLKEGIRDFVLLEKGAQLGGTWRDNTYPGCACDVPSQLYSYTFAPKNDWSRVFAEQPEIQAYQLQVARDHGVMPFVRLETEVQEARWNDSAQRWDVKTNRGELQAQSLVAGFGPLHIPRMPELPGLDSFNGEHFHSATWRHDIDLRDKKVVVVGTGSSAIQFVPEIQPKVAALTVFQRTAAWVLPKPDHAIPPVEKAAFKYLPGFRRGYRATIYGVLEGLQLAQRRPAVMDKLAWAARAHMRAQVPDPQLRERLTPSWSLGCKRLLLSNTWYPAIQEDNVALLSQGVAEVTPTGVIGVDGVEVEADVIIFATGFHATDPPAAKTVFGRGGVGLDATWNGTPQAYLGTTIAGFPNLFFMVGPNLGNGHTSAMVLIEAQAGYIADALVQMRRDRLASVEIRAAVQARYNAKVQEALAGTVWNAGGCASWYLDANGVNSSIYPWTTIDLRRRLRRFDADKYTVVAERPPLRVVGGRSATDPTARTRAPGPISLEGAVVAITGGAHGIGRAAAEHFVRAGATVCIGDLDRKAAQRAADELGGGTAAFGLDVTDRSSFERFVDLVEEKIGPIDIFVSNAGVMPTGSFLDEEDDVHAATMGVNVWGVSLGMRIVGPRMVARRRGHLINVASLAGKTHVPGLATYVASKHAVVGLSAAVREELQGTGVTLTTIMPGPVRTRLSAGIPLTGTMAIEPDDVAAEIVRSVATREGEVAVPRALGLLSALNAVAPERVMRWARRRLRMDRVLTQSDAETRRDYESAFLDPREAVGS